MGIETKVKLMCRAMYRNNHLLWRCQQSCAVGSVRRNFRVIFENGNQRLEKLKWRKHQFKCFSFFTPAIMSYPNRIATKLTSTLLLYSLPLYTKRMCSEFTQLIRKCPVICWTCSLFLPLQVVIWYKISNTKDNLHNIIFSSVKSETLEPVYSLWDSAVPTLPVKNDRHHRSQIAAFWCSVKEGFLLTLRAINLLCVFVPLLMVYPLIYVNSSCFALWLRLLYIGMEYSGATFIKLGQWASTRRDLFSEEFCDQFSGLHHKVRPHSWSHTARTLKQAYGKNWQQILHLSNQQEPIGSGCIAQVYKGYVSTEFVPLAILETMKEMTGKVQFKKDGSVKTDGGNGDAAKSDAVAYDKHFIPVAIKVLHPKINETFQRDLRLMKAASKCLTFLFPRLHWISLKECVEEFAVTMHKQLDMQYEFECLKRFIQDFQSFPNIKVPQPIPAFVRQNILVETFEEGISVSQILRSTDHSVQFKKELADLGFDVLLQMVFVNNFVHADLHPGNLLVQSTKHDETKKRKSVAMFADDLDTIMEDISHLEEPSLKLVLLDCGITASLSPSDRLAFINVFIAIVRGEGETVADLFLSMSRVNHCTDPELFRKEMAQLVTKGCQNLMSISKIKVAELMNDLFTVLSRHRIQLESNFATIILAIAMLEGLGRTLDPTLNLMDKAKPVLLRELSKNVI